MTGKGFLKFSSFFIFIWGIVNIIIAIILVTNFSLAQDIAIGVKEELVSLATINFAATGIVEIIAAKLGFSAAKDASKAGRCIFLSGLIFALTIVPVIYGDTSTINWVSFIASLVIPGLYLLGAFIRKSHVE